MAAESNTFTIGVEEEFLIIDPETRALCPQAARILPRAQEAAGDHVEPEFQLSQLETGTAVCRTLEEVRRQLVQLRRDVASAAGSAGKLIAAAGTHPFSDWRTGEITPKAAYLMLERDYQQLAREQIVCGCHIHVGIANAEDAIQVMNRARPWLSPILALSVNSPFWLGVDTGYGSFRTEIWRRWPMAGTPDVFASRAEYEALVQALLATGSIDDPARIYWDVRPSARFATLEFRMTDVCLSVDEAVMVAALVRALARTCHRQVVEKMPGSRPRPELLRAATWRAARYGIDQELIDLEGERSIPARSVVGKLLEFLEPALVEHDEWDEVSELVQQTISRGTGASRQRRAFARAGRMQDVVDLIVAETAVVGI
jgi:carboxylate-amine ligase